jgi:pimeloyl-ACP methyl ester carboxylesterase
MATHEINGTSLHVEIRGNGPETIFFSHGLLFHHGMWHHQLDAFAERYRCVAWDHRGQGRSGREGGRDMDTLARDAAALIEAVQADTGCGPVHFAGLSMGGFVGLRVAARRPELLRSLALLDSSAEPEVKPGQYALLNTVVRLFGTGPVLGRVQPILFGASTLADPARADTVAFWTEWLRGLPRDVVQAVRGVIHREGVTDELAAIRCPTLVLVGEEDMATSPRKSERLAAGIAGARLVRVPRCGHMSALEDPEAVNAALAGFWDGLG